MKTVLDSQFCLQFCTWTFWICGKSQSACYTYRRRWGCILLSSPGSAPALGRLKFCNSLAEPHYSIHIRLGRNANLLLTYILPLMRRSIPLSGLNTWAALWINIPAKYTSSRVRKKLESSRTRMNNRMPLMWSFRQIIYCLGVSWMQRLRCYT